MVQQAAAVWAAPGSGPQADEPGPELCCRQGCVCGGEGSTTCWPSSWDLPPEAVPVGGGMGAGRQRSGKAAQAALPLHSGRCIPTFPAASLGPVALRGTAQPQPWQAPFLLAAVLAGQQSSRVTGSPPSLRAILQTAEDLFHAPPAAAAARVRAWS